MSRRSLLVVAFFSAFPLLAYAQDAKQAENKVMHSKIADGKKSCGAACQVNFAKELGVPLDYLGSIGHRISLARKIPDPVELALTAQALSVAERVSGKKASITSDQVHAEALELAKMRGISMELSAIALVFPEGKQDLEKLAIVAKKREVENAKDIDNGAKEKALFGTLYVINHSSECLRVFVSGRFVGEVHMGQSASFHVHDHNATTRLDAYCEEEGELVSEQNLFGRFNNYTWHIH